MRGEVQLATDNGGIVVSHGRVAGAGGGGRIYASIASSMAGIRQSDESL